REDVERALLYFRNGRLVFVEQSSLGRTIGAHLVEQGILTRDQYQVIAKAVAAARHESPMMALVEMALQQRLIDASMASAIVGAQVERNFIRCLGWDAGYCRFSARPQVLVNKPVFPCEVEVAVLQGLRHHLGPGDRAELLARYGPRRPLLAKSADTIAREFRLQPRDERFLRGLDASRPLSEQLPDPQGPELDLVVALHYSGRLELPRSERDTPDLDVRPRGEMVSASRIRITLPNPPSQEEVRAAAAFQRGKRLVADEPQEAAPILREAAQLVPRPDYVLYASWAEYVSTSAAGRPALLAGLEEATRRALEWDATFAFGYFVVGHLHLALEDVEAAMLAFDRAQALDPTDPAPSFEIAKIKERRVDMA
ncbi:MAG: hypothetical protein KC619_34825, partial [Myxococcales bacterium]|nr:hypothetical protein [Myxococcales bacterium]